MKEKFQFHTKKDVAVRMLREAILSGKLEVGQRLTQVYIAERLGMSPTPIREAIRELQAQGILSSESYKSVTVADVDLNQAAEVYELRELLESKLVSFGCPNLTGDITRELEQLHGEMCRHVRNGDYKFIRQLNYRFHWLIYDAADRPQWAAVVGRLWTQFPWDTLNVIPGRHAQSMQEHEGILNAVKAGDCLGASRSMEQHIQGGFKALKQYLLRRQHEGSRSRTELAERPTSD
jgi:DNA-binding GntR family transcriptional regulator